METRKRDKFLENFDPEKSTREKRKLTRKIYSLGSEDVLPTRKPTKMYDSRGLIGGVDFCDCLDNTCPGCHFPCPKCASSKCGPECRVNRKWTYEKVEIEGTNP